MKANIEHINIIDALDRQISALLDLMMMSESSVDHQSIKDAAEMCLTLHDEMVVEVNKLWEEVK